MIKIKNLSKHFGDKEALKAIDLECRQNQIVVIIGPSGCGKTTLLRLIAGLETPDEGQILIEERLVGSPGKSIAPHQRGVSLIFQDLALWPHMTVREHMEFVLIKKRIKKDAVLAATEQVLKEVSLAGYNNRYPHELSGGEQQRLAIARAIVTKPKYLLMDEPFSNLDSILKDNLLELVICLKKNTAMGVVCVTHNIDEAFFLADRLAIMNNGCVEQFDSKEKVIEKPKNKFISKLLKIG